MQEIKIGDRVRLTVRNGFIVGNVNDIVLQIKGNDVTSFLMVEADGGFMYPFRVTPYTLRDYDLQVIST